MFRSRQFIFGIVVSIIFLVWALSKEDLGQVGGAILKANYWALLPALLLYFIGVWVRAVRWQILLHPIAPKVGLYKTFEVVVIGYMANDVLPARIGELVRAYVLSKREGVRKSATLATILVERIFDGLVMIGFAAAVVFILAFLVPGGLSTGPGHTLGQVISEKSGLMGLVAVGSLVMLVAFVVVASSKNLAVRLIEIGLRFLPGRLHTRVEAIADSFIVGLGSLRSASGMASVFGLTIVAWLFEATMYWVLGNWGFNLTTSGAPLPFYIQYPVDMVTQWERFHLTTSGAPLPFYAYVLATAFANLSLLLPQGPGGVGVFEKIATTVLASAFGVNSGLALSYVLVLHATLLVPVSILGFVYLARENLSWRDLTDLEKSRASASAQAHELESPFADIELVHDGKIEEGDEGVSGDGGGPAAPLHPIDGANQPQPIADNERAGQREKVK